MATKKANPVFVTMIIDSSGSMYGRVDDVRGGFNQYIAELRKDTENEYRVTAVTFDTHVKTLFTARPLDKVPELTQRNYYPGGNTALYDAIGVTLEEVTSAIKTVKKPYGKDRSVVIVMTDGEENSSTRFSKSTTVDMMKVREAAGNWTFVYLGADQDAWSAAEGLGFAHGNVAAYAGANTRGVFQSLAVSTQSYSQSGVASSTSFAGTITTDTDAK